MNRHILKTSFELTKARTWTLAVFVAALTVPLALQRFHNYQIAAQPVSNGVKMGQIVEGKTNPSIQDEPSAPISNEWILGKPPQDLPDEQTDLMEPAWADWEGGVGHF